MYYPKVFIIILNWNGLKDTLECLESVFKLDYPNFEVIVVDNGSTDNSAEIIPKMYAQVIFVENKQNLGYTGGNNIGMQYAMDNGADYIWLLNNDMVVEPDTLSKLIETAELNFKIGLISPTIYYYDKPEKIQFCGSYIDWEHQTIIYPKDNDEPVAEKFKTSTDVCLWGTALLIKRALVENIGYLNERYFAYWEDTDYSIRSLEAGFKNYVENQAKIKHRNQLTEEGVPRKAIHYYYYMVRNEYYLWSQHLEGFKKIIFFKKYIIKVIETSANYRFHYGEVYSDACFNGAYSAIRGADGPWDENIKMPFILKKILLWHPYLLGNMLRGDILNIFTEITKRVKKRFTRMSKTI